MYLYVFGAVRDTMKTKSAMIASAAFQSLTYSRPFDSLKIRTPR